MIRKACAIFICFLMAIMSISLAAEFSQSSEALNMNKPIDLQLNNSVKDNGSIQEVSYRGSVLESSTVLGSIRNNSYQTLCAEEDNIDISLYYPNAYAYKITATHPAYIPTTVIDQGENWTNCNFANIIRDKKVSTETIKKIYDDGDVVIETVNLDSWWRTGESMTVSIEGGNSEHNVTYFRIYKLIEQTNWDYPQVFVLYEDGNCRIIPQPPLDLNEVKFGSSVIIGASENLERPFADIDLVDIDPSNLSMIITYGDGTTANVAFQVNRSQNIVYVSNVKYDTTNYPFARFRSMWVQDGNADVDSIRTQDGVFSIMNGWTELEGNWWQFYRITPSIHNTYSPDIKIEIIAPVAVWDGLGGNITSSPSAITDSQDKTEVWVKGGDDALWLNIDGSWQGKGGYLTSDPFAAEDYNGRIHVLARGGDNGAWDFIYDPVTQSGEWIGLGGYITEGLTAASDPANHNLMRVAARGGDEALWTCDLDINAKSSSWSFHGGVLTSRPYIIFDPSGGEHILVRGGDNALWDRNGEWTGSSYIRTWSPLGGILANSPVATIEPGADSHIAVFAKGGDDAIWMCDVDSSSETETGSWHRLGGVISSDIFAVTDISRSKIHTFARGSDMALWENAFTTSPWNPDGGQWQYLGGSILDYRPGATIAAITQAFVIGTDNGLWQNMQVTASATAGDARSGEGDAERLHELSQN